MTTGRRDMLPCARFLRCHRQAMAGREQVDERLDFDTKYCSRYPRRTGVTNSEWRIRLLRSPFVANQGCVLRLTGLAQSFVVLPILPLARFAAVSHLLATRTLHEMGEAETAFGAFGIFNLRVPCPAAAAANFHGIIRIRARQCKRKLSGGDSKPVKCPFPSSR